MLRLALSTIYSVSTVSLSLTTPTPTLKTILSETVEFKYFF
ncbi:hypothetical protein BSPLISOX_2484 [uncultured Gammaproteobacteria bacterium]|nr:hypothetical protein [uncultured Gammaproteobacteria bacterium]CAC9465045.1 hypothetical protein [uncultured Gammaproteobacteria bacterium]CAC9466580.1 hypothetical protein [uncultured Gammaproteobacteria bacterium]CAC9473995.1 hypothetical protein [uncultured Gammaproteobacteria bacterium]VVH66604.1 hypothetical protein BSPLISOX_2484 [uncultured Gammaproteobacteria bacterium]